MAARKKKSRKRKGSKAPKRDELTRIHVAHLRKRYSALKKSLRSKNQTESQHEKTLAEARSVRSKLERYKGNGK
jgi:hypothetical protein